MSAESTFRSDGFCELDQYKLYYELHGDERREKIMLIAGAFCTRRIFDGLVARLAQDFQVLIFDNRGTGRSTASPRWRRPAR